MADKKYSIWLSYLHEIGIKSIRSLIQSLGSPQEVYNASKKELISAWGISEGTADKIISLRKSVDIEETIENMVESNMDYICFDDERFPEDLRHIDDPPLGFFILGRMPEETFLKIGIVGTRRCSQYGKNTAYKLSKDLASKDIVIVSGLAEGIDASAHQGAVDSKGKCIAVLGSGVDVCYPSENRPLYHKLMESGAVISEFPPGTKPKPWFFPMRNRLISGMSKGVLIVEAPLKSGALITVGHALDQGREVFAVPGNITSRFSEGTNKLIKEGACIVTSASDIMDALGYICIEKEILQDNVKDIQLAPDEKLVYDCISSDPTDFDEIVYKTKMKIQNVQYVLTKLELNGKIKKLPGQRFIVT